MVKLSLYWLQFYQTRGQFYLAKVESKSPPDRISLNCNGNWFWSWDYKFLSRLAEFYSQLCLIRFLSATIQPKTNWFGKYVMIPYYHHLSLKMIENSLSKKASTSQTIFYRNFESQERETKLFNETQATIFWNPSLQKLGTSSLLLFSCHSGFCSRKRVVKSFRRILFCRTIVCLSLTIIHSKEFRQIGIVADDVDLMHRFIL